MSKNAQARYPSDYSLFKLVFSFRRLEEYNSGSMNSSIIKEQVPRCDTCSFIIGDPSESLNSNARFYTAITFTCPDRAFLANLRFAELDSCLKSCKAKEEPHVVKFLFYFGDPSESRTPDTMIKSHVLCHLSLWVDFVYLSIITYFVGFVNLFPFVKTAKDRFIILQ